MILKSDLDFVWYLRQSDIYKTYHAEIDVDSEKIIIAFMYT